MKKILLHLVFSLAFIYGASASERFWVGGSGNWKDAKHWSEKSGGIPGASVPASVDDVIFDSNSFSSDGQQAIIDADAECRNMIWKNMVAISVLAGDAKNSLHVYGFLSFAPEMTNDFKGQIVFNSTQTSNTIFSANQIFHGDVVFDGEKGEWKLLDDIRTSGEASIYLIRGTLNTNNKNIFCHSFIGSGDKNRSLILGSSKIIVRTLWDFSTTANLFFDAGKSNILLPKEKNENTFIPGNLKYNDLSIASGNCVPSGNPCAFFTITLTMTPDSCNGPPCNGTATGTISGGTGPFTYNWLPSGQTTTTITGLCPGTPSIEVIDGLGNLCDCFITITEPPVLNANITPPAPVTSCSGVCDGSATASGVGGIPPYTYSWNTIPVQTTPLGTGLCAGTNTVTVTDSYGCIKIKTFTVGSPLPLVATGSSTTINCFGNCNGSACVAPTGGTTPYTYLWSPGSSTTSCVSGLCLTPVLTCTVTDANGCIDVYSTSITQPPLLTVTVTGTNLLCNGDCIGSVTATASGGVTPYTYSWTGGCATSACTGLCAGNYTLTLTDANGCIKTSTVAITEPPPLILIPTGTNINCFGQCTGTATATVSGGTPAYTYSWCNGQTTSTATGLCVGSCTVLVTDANGCTKSGTVTITQPPLLTVTATATNVTCFLSCNGSVTATASGGTAPYTYTWSNGCSTSSCSGLCAGNYTITVADSKTCTATATVAITQPPPLLPNLSMTPATCNGICDGTVTSSASGGTPGYTYLWALGGCTTSTCTGLCAGNYTLTLTDANGCPASATVSITQPSTLTVSITASPNPLNCNGDCNATAAVSVSGGTAPYTYLWLPGPQTTPSVSALCAGNYTVTVTDFNGCTAAATVSITQPAPLVVSTATVNPTCSGMCNGSITATPSGGTPAYTYLWNPVGQTTSSITGLCIGTYTLTVTDSKGCNVTQTFTLTAPAVLAANASVVSNVPCTGQCNGSATASPSGGTLPYTYLWNPGSSTAQTITGLCAGTYSVLVTDANNCTDIGIITITQPALFLSASISSTTSSCTSCNGSATVSPSGGTLPYTYLWTPTFQTTQTATGLCIGAYTVTVTDANNCTATATTTISPIVTITVTVSGSGSVSCTGFCDGIATATPFGGANPYTYLWCNGQTTSTATGLCAGSCTVTVADTNGCVATNTVTFTNPPVLTATVSSTVASCGICNGTATASPSGGTGGYTYLWAPFPFQTTATATGLCSGNYTVTVNDANNCTFTNTVTVGNIPAISPNPTVVDANCGLSDGSICLSPTGGTPSYTYSWSTGPTTSCLTAIPAGTYTVTITDAAGCANTTPIAVSNISTLSLTVTAQINPVCYSDCNGFISVSALGGTPPYNYLWTPGAYTTTSVAGLCAGTYIIQVIDAVPCTTFVTVVLTDPPPFVPNPVITNVSCNGGNNGSICLSPTGGISPYTYQWNPSGQTTSCATGLTAGCYSVIITDATGCDDTIPICVTEPAALSVTLASTNVTCNGNGNGTATATVTGGTAPLTYLWSTGAPILTIAGLVPAVYSFTVTDANGCTDTASVLITEPAIFTTTLTSTNELCNGDCNGTATITASGGTTAYTYSWNPLVQTTSTVTGLCAGTYIGTVTDANGCSSSQTVTITQPLVLTTTVTPTNGTCFGGCNGSAISSVSGGTIPYTYSWMPTAQTTSNATGLCAGSYTFSVTDANGCNTIQLFSITEPPELFANITNTPPSCSGGCNGTATSSPIGGVPPYTFLWCNGQTTSTATGLCAGTCTLIVSDANGCADTATTIIVAPSPITISSAATQATCGVCNGSITVIPSGGTPGYTYLWNPPAGGQTTATITGLCADLYIVIVTDANGCTEDDTIPLSNTTGPSLVTTGTNITCFGFCNGTATVTATGDGPIWIYLWSDVFAQTTATATGLCPASPYFISVTDTNGCVTFDTITITQPAALASNPTITNATCFGLCDGSIVLTPSGGTGAYTFNWAGGQTTSSISAQCAGNYTVTITDANGCVLTTTMTIGQNTILTSTVTSTNDSCNASCDGTAAMNVSGGTLPYTYLWCNGQTTSTATGLCAGTCTVTISDAIGCIHNNSVIITEPAVLAPNITGTNPLCNGDCNGNVSASPIGGTPPYTYAWSNGCSTSTCTGLCAGTYTLTLIDANNCSVTNTVVLTDPAVISLTDSVVNANCANVCDGSIDITPAGGTGAYTFFWSNSAVTEDITGLCAGIYSVTITDANGCSFTDSMTVGVITLVISGAGNDTSFCTGGTATLCSNSFNATSIAWYQLPGWTLIGSTNCISVSPPAGVDSIALIATNGICSDTDTVSVTVNNYPVLVSSNDTTICMGDSVTLCSSGANNYQWYTLPGWIPITPGNCITVSPAVGTINYGIIGMNGVCADTDSVSVTVLAMPVANAGNDVSFCQGGSTMLCDTLSMNGTLSVWYELPLWTFVDSDSCAIVSPSITTDYAVIVSNGICSDTDTVTVTIYPLPPVDAGTSVTILSTASTGLSGTGNGTYLWSPATGLSCTTCANPTANPTVSTTYTLTVTDINGCIAWDTVRVTIVTDVIVNDGLSPNGDGINDVWEIPNIEQFPDALVEIYNRWGELLFHSIGYKEKWNCKYNGKDLPVGTYYYVINLNSDLHPDPITGPITILR